MQRVENLKAIISEATERETQTEENPPLLFNLISFCDIFEPGFQKSLNQRVAVGDGVMNREMKHTILTAFFINSMERTKGDERIKKATNFKLCSYFFLIKN